MRSIASVAALLFITGLLTAPSALAGDSADDTNTVWSVTPTGERTVLAPPGGLDIAPTGAWSPDSKQVAFVRYTSTLGTPSDAGRLIVKAGDGSAPETTLATNVGLLDSRPAWSPDGTRIAFADPRGDIRTVAPTGGRVKLLARANDAEHLRWSPDGTALVYTDEYPRACPGVDNGATALTNVIHVVTADGKKTRLTTTGSCKPTRTTSDEFPVWTDNDHVAFIRSLRNLVTDTPSTSTIYIAPVDNPTRLRKLAVPTKSKWFVQGGDLVRSPDGRSLVAEIEPFTLAPGEVDIADASQLWVLSVDGKTTRKLPLRAFEGGAPSVAPNGDVTDCGNRGVIRFDAQTGKRKLIARFEDCLTGDWAPDGSRFLVAANSSN